MAGSYTFDFGLQLGATFSFNSGTVASRTFYQYRRNIPLRVDEPYYYGGMTNRWLADDSVGSLENDSWSTIDLRGAYTFALGRSVALELFLDVFNALDDQAAVRNQDLLAGNAGVAFGEPLQWVPPRRMYLGARLSF